MNATIAWLTSNPSSVTPAFGETVNGVNISYGYVYDTVNIIRNHNYAMQIQIKFHPTPGFLNMWRDGVQIVSYTRRLGFGFNTYCNYSLYRAPGSDTQVAQYKNFLLTAGPYSLGTAAAYVPIAGDVGTALTLTVKATNSFGSASATSVANGVVSSVDP
jgi:hypothetical protein